MSAPADSSEPQPISSSQLPELSAEQAAVFSSVIKKSRNVVVNAVAGSGKTRTALATAIGWLTSRTATSAPQSVLLAVYNKRLQQDMLLQSNQLVPAHLRDFLHITTIHSLGHRYFGGHGLTTERELSKWVGQTPSVPLPRFGLVIIDEAQDLTGVLFNFLHHILKLQNRPFLLILGDPFQLLYRSMNAHERYLLEADDNFGDVVADAPFEYLKLSICFRITHEMAEWINKHLNPNNLCNATNREWFDQHKQNIAKLWGEGIRANPSRPPAPNSLTYFERPRNANGLYSVVQQITAVFEQYDMESSVLLAVSVRGSNRNAIDRSPTKLITNQLKRVGGAPQSWFFDDGSTNSTVTKVMQHKRVASTIHKFKGRERDAIVLVGLDHFYERVHAQRNLDPRDLFNMFYVAVTRAKKHLLIIQWSEVAYATHLSRRQQLGRDAPKDRPPCDVEDALRFCPFNKMLCEESDECLQSKTIGLVPDMKLSHEDMLVPGAHTSRRLSTLEDVSSSIANAVVLKLELLLDCGRLQIPPFDEDDQMPQEMRVYLNDVREKAIMRTEEYSWADLLKMATTFATLSDRRYSRWRQVRDFERWPVALKGKKLDELLKNLVRMLDMAVKDTEGEMVQGSNKTAIDGVEYEQVVERLKQLREDEKIVFGPSFMFDMRKNAAFEQQCSSHLVGTADIILLQKQPNHQVESSVSNLDKHMAAVSLREQSRTHNRNETDSDNMLGKIQAEKKTSAGGMTIVKIRMTSEKEHDDLLRMGCYGAMARESEVRRHAVTGDSSGRMMRPGEGDMLKLLVTYAAVGELVSVKLNMNSFEFLHRVGFRKVNRPFDHTILEDQSS